MDMQWVPHQRETWPFRIGDLKEDVIFTTNDFERVVKKGTPVKIVMVSRFGDVGITDNLKAEHGYHARVTFDQLENLR
jgi:hypothetical protein